MIDREELKTRLLSSAKSGVDNLALNGNFREHYKNLIAYLESEPDTTAVELEVTDTLPGVNIQRARNVYINYTTNHFKGA